MEEKIKLSVIVPVYNVQEYLKECVDSILRQDYPFFELILVNDGSTDESGKICDAYAEADKRIQIIHQENQGHTAARQKGFLSAKGQYVLFIDSDDWIDEGMFSAMMNQADEEKLDIIQCGYRSVKNGIGRDEVPVYEAGIYDKKQLEEEIYPSMIYAGGYYRFGIAPNMWNKIFRRELVEEFLFKIDRRIKSGEDGLLTFSCFLKAERVQILHECFYNYRSRAVSMCRITDDRRLEQNHLLFSCYEERFYDNLVLKNQIEHYVVYQTLQAVAELSKTQGIFKIKKEHPYLKKNSLERKSIQTIGFSEIQGKKNKLILAGLKL